MSPKRVKSMSSLRFNTAWTFIWFRLWFQVGFLSTGLLPRQMKVILFSFPTSKVGISTESWGRREGGSALEITGASQCENILGYLRSTNFLNDCNEETSCTPIYEEPNASSDCCLHTWYCFSLPSFVFKHPSLSEALKMKYTLEVLSGVRKTRIQKKVFCWFLFSSLTEVAVMY